MKKGKFILYLVLAASCMAFVAGCANSKKQETENQEKLKVMIKNSEETPNKITEEDQPQNESDDSGKKTEIELIGMDEKQLDILGIKKEKIEEAFQKWTSENGYASASGAVFYEPMCIFFSEEKYSMNCYLTFDDNGNGIHPENEEKMIVMDYYKAKNLIQFHE